VQPPTQFLERALGDRPNPCNTKAACAHVSDSSRDMGVLKGDRELLK
jgi:hypothetical protein